MAACVAFGSTRSGLVVVGDRYGKRPGSELRQLYPRERPRERRRFDTSASGERSCHASTASSWSGFATKPAGPIVSSVRQTSGDELRSPESNPGAVASSRRGFGMP